MSATSGLLLAFAVLLVNCQAQSDLPPSAPININNTLLNLTFSIPRDTSCGRAATQRNESATIIVGTAPLAPTCLDLDYTFTHPNETEPPGTHYNLTNYGMLYTVTSPAGNDSVGWSPDIFNYSQVLYSQRRTDIDGVENTAALGYVMVRAFSENGCPGQGTNMTAGSWYSWNCQDEEGHCHTLPFSVRSVLFSGLSEGYGRPGDQGCANAVRYNDGNRVGMAPSITMALAFLAAAVAMLW